MSKSPNRALAVTFGVLYLCIGMFGVAATNSATLFGHPGGLLFELFEVNIFANAVHAIIGLGLIIAGASTTSAAKSVNRVVGAILVVIGVAGFFLLNNDVNILATNDPTNVLHTATGLILLLTAIGADRPAPKLAS